MNSICQKNNTCNFFSLAWRGQNSNCFCLCFFRLGNFTRNSVKKGDKKLRGKFKIFHNYLNLKLLRKMHFQLFKRMGDYGKLYLGVCADQNIYAEAQKTNNIGVVGLLRPEKKNIFATNTLAKTRYSHFKFLVIWFERKTTTNQLFCL